MIGTGITKVIVTVIEVLVIFAIGFGFGFDCGHEEGMKSMKEIDDRIIEEISETIYVKEEES